MSVGSPTSTVSGKECEYSGEPDKVQSPTATAPRVVSPTMPMHLRHCLLDFGWLSLHPFFVAAQIHSKKKNKLQYGNLFKDEEATLSKLQVKWEDFSSLEYVTG